MKIPIEYGRERIDFEVTNENLVGLQRGPIGHSLLDLGSAVREALEQPFGFPALRKALTPDDHVAIVVDEGMPEVARVLTPILKHLKSAEICPENVTLLCQPGNGQQHWLEDLPEEFQEVHIEIHDPTERKKLAYLATMRHGRRLYLNRTAVDADQLIIVTRRRYDPVLGYGGGQGEIFPAFSDEETRRELETKLSHHSPGHSPWPVQQEATESAWLLGAPFFVQLIEGVGDAMSHVIAGVAGSLSEGERLLNARWRATAERPADLVVAAISGDPARQGFDTLARAAACAARVIRPDGKIVVLSDIEPKLQAGVEALRAFEDPKEAWTAIEKSRPPDLAAVFQWVHAVQQAKVYLLSRLSEEAAEELFAVPLTQASEAQRLINLGGSCIFLPDAHKMLAVVAETG